MEIKNAKRWSKFSQTQSWVGTLGLVALAFLLTDLFNPVLKGEAPLHIFIVACLVVQFWFGYSYALLAWAISYGLAQYYFVEPFGQYAVLEWPDIARGLNFALVVVVATLVIERLQRSLYAQTLVAKVTASRRKIALHRENDKLYYAKQTNELAFLLDELLDEGTQAFLIRVQDQQNEPYFIPARHFYKLTGLSRLSDRKEWSKNFSPEDEAKLLAKMDLAAEQKPSSPIELRLLPTDASIALTVQRYVVLEKHVVVARMASSEAVSV